MAKNEMSSQITTDSKSPNSLEAKDVQAQPSIVAPSVVNQKMPLEKKEEDHAQVLRDPNQALLPGKLTVLNGGMLGDIESEIIKAERAGKMELAGLLNSILMKFSTLQQELKSVENHAEISLLSFYKKLKQHF